MKKPRDEGADSTRPDLRDSPELLMQLDSSSQKNLEHEVPYIAPRDSFDSHRPCLFFRQWRRFIGKFDKEQADD